MSQDDILRAAASGEDAMLRAHIGPGDCDGVPCAPEAPQTEPVAEKTPARWAYERLALYMQSFEQGLDSAHELAMGFTAAATGLLRIEGIGYFDPDIITFYGTDDEGVKTQLIQHVGQLNVALRAIPVPDPAREPLRIGFRLVRDMAAETAQPETTPPETVPPGADTPKADAPETDAPETDTSETTPAGRPGAAG